MAISFVEAGTFTVFDVSPQSTWTMTRPASWTAGRVVVYTITAGSMGTNILSSHPGSEVVAWTSPNTHTIHAGTGVYVVPPSPPADMVVTWTSAQRGDWVWMVFDGVDTSSPVVGSGASAWSSSGTSSTAPSISSVPAGSMVLGGLDLSSGSRSATFPAGWTQRAQGDERDGFLATKGVQASTGATGTAAFSFGGSATQARAWQMALLEGEAPAVEGSIAETIPAPVDAVEADLLVTGAVEESIPAPVEAIAAEVDVVVPLVGELHDTIPAPVEELTGTVASIEASLAETIPMPGDGGVVKVAPSPLPSSGSVTATVETQQFPSGTGDIADDPCIFVHPTTPALSVIIGTNKIDGTAGGLAVYNLNGTIRGYYSGWSINNVDIRQGVFDGRVLLAGSDRTGNGLRFWWLDPDERTITNAGFHSLGYEPYGITLYQSPVDGDVYTVVSGANTPFQLRQHRLTESGGTITATEVRNLGDTNGQAEGMAGDDEQGFIFVGEEDTGLHRYGGEPGDGTTRFTIDTTGGGGNLVVDVEGVAIVKSPTGGPEYLLVSSQGDSSYHVYDRRPPHAHRRRFTVAGSGDVDAATDTDGLDVTRANLGSAWPTGVVVVHDNNNTGSGATMSNFKLVGAEKMFGPWEAPETTGGSIEDIFPDLVEAATVTLTASGSLTEDVPAPSEALGADLRVSGALADTIPTPVDSVAAEALLEALLAESIPAPVEAIGAEVSAPPIEGSLAETIPAPVEALDVGLSVTATVADLIPMPGMAATGVLLVTGTLSDTIPAPQESILGAGAGVHGSLHETIPAPTETFSGSVAFVGTLSEDVPAPADSLLVDVAARCELVEDVPPPMEALTGNVTSTSLTGSLGEAFPDLVEAIVVFNHAPPPEGPPVFDHPRAELAPNLARAEVLH